MGSITILPKQNRLKTHLNACLKGTCDMNKYVIGIFGVMMLTVCGVKFQTDSDILMLLVIGFALIVLASDKKKG